MVSFAQGLSNAFKALDCSILSGADYVFGSLNRATGVVDPTSSNVINAIRRLRGCDPVDDPVPPPPAFTGGQCVGKPYRYQYRVIQENGTVGPFIIIQCANNRFGPIGLRTETSPTGIVRWFIQSSNAAGDRSDSLVASSNSQITVQLQIISTCNGTADNCGNPPTLVPPTNITTNIDVTYNIDDGTEVTVNIPITIKPFFQDFSGTFNFPFDFNLGGVDLSGTFTLSPDLSVNINLPRAPQATKDPTETLPPGDPADEVPPVAVEDKVIGVVAIAEIQGEQQFTTIATQGMPPILAPRAGSIKFAYSVGVSTFWSDDIDVKTGRTFIPCPFSQGADAVVVSPAPGVAVSWVAITGSPLATARDVLSTREL